MRETTMYHAFSNIKVGKAGLTPLHKMILRSLERYAKRENARQQRVRAAHPVREVREQ